MGRAPNNPELHELANRLSRLAYTGPTIHKAPGCHRFNGAIRVTRTFRGELLTLGVTHDMGAAGMYSDCLTRLLHDYVSDSEVPIDPGVFNVPPEIAGDNPEIGALAGRVVEYLREKGYLRPYEELFAARRMTKLVLSDFDAKIAEARRELRKIEIDRARAAESLADLYRL